MRRVQETSAVFFSTLCFSLAAGAWLGSFSLDFFRLTEAVAKKNIAIAIESAPARHESIRVPILVYHSVRPHQTKESAYQELYDVTPALLRRQLTYLQENGYTTISFGALADYFDTGATLPEKSVILTFDDGWKNQYEYAFPLLKEFHSTATFFIFTNAVNRGNHLTWEQLHEMQSTGISIEAHTKTHPYLQKITDPEELAREITGSKKILEEELGIKVISIAYPFGKYNDASIAEIKNSGFLVARSLRGGVVQSESERYILRASLATDNFEDFVRLLEK
jgi:peptidoglycan/xylan/chitin deacetylase (PgdA/CDA1 family)